MFNFKQKLKVPGFMGGKKQKDKTIVETATEEPAENGNDNVSELSAVAEETMKPFPMEETIGKDARKKRMFSPVTLVIIIAIIVAGAGTATFMQFRDGLKFTMNKKAQGPSLKKPAGSDGAVSGIQFDESKLIQGKTDGTPAATGSGQPAAQSAPPVSQTAQQPSTAKMTPPAASAPAAKATPAASSASLSPATPSPAGETPKAAAPTTPPKSPQAPQSPTQVQKAQSVTSSPAPAATVTMTPAATTNEKLPVPIKLALKDDAPFRDRFEQKYGGKMQKDAKGAGIPGAAGSQRGMPIPPTGPGGKPVDIKDLMLSDGKPLAPGVVPNAAGLFDGPGMAAVEKISLYGVMISGGKKVAITSRGEVQVGGKLYGEPVVDITPSGVKLKSGRVLQVAVD